MPRLRLAVLAAAFGAVPLLSSAQDLTPRAYTLTPVSSNAVIGSYIFTKGDILFDPAIPITDASATIHTPILSYYYAFSLLGRSANVTASLPWTSGTFSGSLPGGDARVTRHGLLDSLYRVAVNLRGGPALRLQDFVKTPPPRTIIGASLRVIAPTGSYVRTRAINPGNNRWAFKPEAGLSRRYNRVLVDAYAGVWFYTANDDYFARTPDAPGSVREQKPIGSLEGHLSYDFKPRYWISLDLNYWYGGRVTTNGALSVTSLQANSRIGVTGSVPITSNQALKASYSDGVVTRVGGTFQALSVAWQYSWVAGSGRN